MFDIVWLISLDVDVVRFKIWELPTKHHEEGMKFSQALKNLFSLNSKLCTLFYDGSRPLYDDQLDEEWNDEYIENADDDDDAWRD